MNQESIGHRSRNPDQLTVLMVDKALVCGGRQRIVVELSVGLQRMYGIRVVVASGYGLFVEELKERGVTYECIPGDNYGMQHQLKSARLLKRLVCKYNPNIIHSHCRYHNLSSFLAVSLLRAPAKRITTAHNVFPDHHWKGFFPKHTICVSPAVQSYVERVSNAETHVILNGMPEQKSIRATEEVTGELCMRDDEVILLNVARLDEQKAQNFLLEAFHQLTKVGNLPPVRLLIAGEGPLRSRLEADIKRFQLEEQVILLGERNDIADLLAAADIFVLSSKWEGLPVTLIEAACVGLPLVTFDVGGVAEIVQDQVTGLLLKPGDVQGLSKALIELVGEKGRRRTMGDAAKALYKSKFSIERCVEQTENYYREVLSQTS